MPKKRGFTLVEITIVLVVIGVITAILMPAAFHSTPDEDIMKFKKANSTLYQVINELVTSDKYYCNGDLGIKADCNTPIKNNPETRTYLCETIANLVSAKEVNCYTGSSNSKDHWLLSNENVFAVASLNDKSRVITEAKILATKQIFDQYCKEKASVIGKEITMTDNVVFHQTSASGFGSDTVSANQNNHLTEDLHLRYFTPPNIHPANYSDRDTGFDIAYKIFCIDIDGFDETEGSDNCDDVNDICPFGYGIRADGYILPGARAQEWLEKSIQSKGKEN